MLLVLVILLCGVSSYMGVLNIKLGLQLQENGENDVPIQFLPHSTASTDSGENSTVTDGVLPGVEGRTVSVPEQSFYHWPAGVVVTKVVPGSDAAKAGMTIGDIITQVNARPIADTDDLAAVLQDVKPGEANFVTFCRDDGSYHSYQCTRE